MPPFLEITTFDSLYGDEDMHVLTIQTKFTFGDRVRFDSMAQGVSGSGTIFAITVDDQRRIDYIVAIGEGLDHRLQAGILEEELKLDAGK